MNVFCYIVAGAVKKKQCGSRRIRCPPCCNFFRAHVAFAAPRSRGGRPEQCCEAVRSRSCRFTFSALDRRREMSCPAGTISVIPARRDFFPLFTARRTATGRAAVCGSCDRRTGAQRREVTTRQQPCRALSPSQACRRRRCSQPGAEQYWLVRNDKTCCDLNFRLLRHPTR